MKSPFQQTKNLWWVAYLILGAISAPDRPLAEEDLETIRVTGATAQQRQHVWSVLARVWADKVDTRSAGFEAWHGEQETFANDSKPRTQGIRGFARGPSEPQLAHSGGITGTPVFAYTLYNDAAYAHIKDNRLFNRSQLERLRLFGEPEPGIPGNRKIPDFPIDAIILKTSWWPVAAEGLTAFPVWDPAINPANPSGNSYLGWNRVVAIDPTLSNDATNTAAIEFAGKRYDAVRRVALSDFHYVKIDADLAIQIMRDREAGMMILIALGRPLKPGDYLVLASANLATHELHNWIWAAIWWHDEADRGPLGADRPPAQPSSLSRYLMETAWDSDKPNEVDGSPHICFNPWLEGRFPGGGTTSNCLACHLRASYPAKDFMPPTRGRPRIESDPAYSPGTLRTSLIWAIAIHSHP